MSRAILVAACATTFAVLPLRPANAFLSATMGTGCQLPDNSVKAMQVDEDWAARIEAFLPEPDPPALRLLTLKDETGADAQVLMAKSGLRQVCSAYRAGQLSQADADNALSGHEQTIRDFLRDKAGEAYKKAGAGQVAQMDEVRTALTQVAQVGRQAALLGLDEIEEQSRKTLLNTLDVFDSALAKSCKNQVFDSDAIFGLMRQEGLVGMNHELEPCAYRLLKADSADGRQSWSIHHCGLGLGEWKLKASGWLTGAGTGQTDVQGDGDFSVHYTQFSHFETDGSEKGTLRFYCKPDEACKCWKDPFTKECKDKYKGQVPPIQMLLDFTLESVTGSIKLPNANLPFPTVAGAGVFSHMKQTPLVYDKVGKPCDPAKADQ